MNDAFGDAGRARRIKDVPRVIERKSFVDEWSTAEGREKVVPGQRLWRRVADDHRRTNSGQPGDYLAQALTAIEALASIGVVRRREQDRGLDLPEAVDHSFDTEIGRCGRVDGADRQIGRAS